MGPVKKIARGRLMRSSELIPRSPYPS